MPPYLAWEHTDRLFSSGAIPYTPQFGQDDNELFPYELPSPSAAYDSTNEAPWVRPRFLAQSVPAASQVVQEEWDRSRPQESASVPGPVTQPHHHHTEQASSRQRLLLPTYIHPYALNPSAASTSHAHSSDIGQSPRIFSYNRGVQISSQTSSNTPSEFGLNINMQLGEEASEPVGVEAGVDLSFMEGIGDFAPEDFGCLPSETFYDPTVPDLEDFDRHSTPQHVTAHTGGHFAALPGRGVESQSYLPVHRDSSDLDFNDNVIFSHTSAPRLIERASQNDHPYGVGYGTMSDKWEPTVPNSYPTTQHHYLPFADQAVNGVKQGPTTVVPSSRDRPQHRPRAESSPQQTQNRTLLTSSGIFKNRRRKSTASNTKPLAAILEGRIASAHAEQVIEQDGVQSQPLSRGPSDKGRARRVGPLSEDARTAAADKRVKGTTCIDCKAQKIKVSRCPFGHPAKRSLRTRSAWAIFPARNVGTVASLAYWQSFQSLYGRLRATADVRSLDTQEEFC